MVHHDACVVPRRLLRLCVALASAHVASAQAAKAAAIATVSNAVSRRGVARDAALALKFLLHPATVGTPLSEKREFLLTRGFSEAEVAVAAACAPADTEDKSKAVLIASRFLLHPCTAPLSPPPASHLVHVHMCM